MSYLVKKWWFLQNVHRTIRYWTLQNESDQEVFSDRRVSINKYGIVMGDNNYPGIARRFLWWPYKYSTGRLRNRAEAYNDIFELCVTEHFIKIVPSERGPMIAKDVRFSEMYGFPKLVHVLYDELSGFWKLLFWLIPIVLALRVPIWDYVKNALDSADVREYEKIETTIQRPASR